MLPGHPVLLCVVIVLFSYSQAALGAGPVKEPENMATLSGQGSACSLGL